MSVVKAAAPGESPPSEGLIEGQGLCRWGLTVCVCRISSQKSRGQVPGGGAADSIETYVWKLQATLALLRITRDMRLRSSSSGHCLLAADVPLFTL